MVLFFCDQAIIYFQRKHFNKKREAKMDSTRLFNSIRDEEQFEGFQQFENNHLWDHTNQ